MKGLLNSIQTVEDMEMRVFWLYFDNNFNGNKEKDR